MKAETMRNFAAGILVAAGILGAVYYLGPSKGTGTVEEMKSALASKGYVVHTQEEWNKASGVKTTDKNSETATVGKKEKVKITVAEGMTSIDVGKALAQEKLIEKSRIFTDEVEKRGLSTKLRPGTYEVERGMTLDQIISSFFKK
ncbi:MAG TPA: hypothetical protein DDY49_15425 [Paenibacillaceae bacterium]|nr:hypothetical protein [Paenibacillaceae bacterium]